MLIPPKLQRLKAYFGSEGDDLRLLVERAPINPRDNRQWMALRFNLTVDEFIDLFADNRDTTVERSQGYRLVLTLRKEPLD